MNPDSDPPFAAIGDHYAIGREIGRGGMAVVYAAEDRKHHRRVAIKVLGAEVSASVGLARFLREIEITARLSHPHILPLYDSGAAGDRLYYVMPLVEGGSLRERLRRGPPMSVEEAVRIICDVASALAHAHAHSVVHRDIKPENILLSDGIGLVADFGIARALGGTATGTLTESGIVVGTPTYMSPEQVSGAELDGRSDLYSLACVLYEAIAGEPPFCGANWMAILQQHLSAEARPIGEIRHVPSAVATAVHRALAKRPEDRFASAARMAEALQLGATLLSTPRTTHVAELAIPNNLPRQRTSFVGREQQLAECARLLGEARALTLTGVGGCGKTRLALRVAENLLEAFPDGVWFVDLAPISDSREVAAAASSVLDVRGEPGEPPVDALARAVRDKRLLLILDNCEHVLSAASALVDRLLAERSEIRLLATSRESLGVEGERLFGVRPLSLPGEDDPLPAVESAAPESVRLFFERARTVESRLDWGAETTLAVTEICRRLDGIPLAIELAAARTKVLSVEQIRSLLDDRFRLLTGGSKALPRHQTLRTAIQWSYEHLDAEEQALFEALAVFAGGWSLPGAAAVAGEAADEFVVLEVMSRLIDKSLVSVESRDRDLLRYRMLETVRQFAQERLDHSAQGESARARHFAYYAAMADELESSLLDERQASALARLRPEQENFLLALEWSRRSGNELEGALRLAGSLRHYWVNRGLMALGSRVTLELLERAGSDVAPKSRASALNAVGFLEHLRGEVESAQQHLDEALELCRAIGDETGVMLVLGNLANIEVDFGRYDEARKHFDESIAIGRRLGEDVVAADSMNSLAESLCLQGKVDEALPLYEEAAARALGGGSRILAAIIVLNVAREALMRRDAEEARRHLIRAFEACGDVGSEYLDRQLLDIGAAWIAAAGAPGSAARWWSAADAFGRRGGARRWPADERLVSRAIAEAREVTGDAAWDAAWRDGAQVPLSKLVGELRSSLAGGRLDASTAARSLGVQNAGAAITDSTNDGDSPR